MALSIYTLVLALFAACFLVLAVLVKRRATTSFDLTVAHWIQGTNQPALVAWLTHSSVYSWVLTNVSVPGYAPWGLVSYAVVFLTLFALGLRIEASIAVGGALFASLAGSLVRNLIGRARPSPDVLHVVRHINGPGFPSGHVMMYVPLFGFAFYVVLIAWRWSALKVAALCVLGALVLLIGASRVYLGAHWPTDTIGAYLLGWLILTGMVAVHRFFLRRFGTRRGAWSRVPGPESPR